MAETVLEIAGLEARYGTVPAVRNVSLVLERGSVLGLVGPNGAGKTTTLLAIMGALKPYAGQIWLAGQAIGGRRPEAIARRGIALVPEGREIFAEFTVEENLRLGLVARRSREAAGAAFDRVHELFPILREFRNRHAGELSGGQQQQLAIARALVAEPDVLLLDEPTLGLAPTVVESLFAALADIRSRGVTIMLVEQRAQLTVEFADATHVMRSGEIVATLTPADADDTERMTEAYFGA